MDIQKDDVRGVRLDKVDGFDSIVAHTDHFEVARSFKKILKFLAGQWFVVDDQNAKRHLLIVGGRARRKAKKESKGRKGAQGLNAHTNLFEPAVLLAESERSAVG